MSDVIKLLPDSVANQIAAGEVIQRPASVVKELVENAVDAGATSIQVIIKDAGRTLVQIVDNGCGMSPMDARMAFERHSTSKITAAVDLFSLTTMGFRGEALASIAAVAQVDLKTMRRSDTVGTRILISGSTVESQEPVATAPGTNMMVKNLFFNVPARRKFLKKDSVELSNIVHEFERLALVNPQLELTLISNDSVVHQLLKGSLKQRIGGLFGKSLERQLIPVETSTSLVEISGFVGLPENARRRGALQYFFVNGRNMRHPYFHKAVMHCYEQLIRPDEQPCYFLNFHVDPATIDVNIHPTKNEIKFENEQPIWQILVAAIKESLGKYNAGPAIDFDAVDVPDIPAFNPDASAAVDLSIDTSYNPFAPNQTLSSSSASRPSAMNSWKKDRAAAIDDWDKLYSQFQAATEIRPEAASADIDAVDAPSRLNDNVVETSDVETALAISDDPAVPVGQAPTMMQLKNRYILSQCRGGLLVVDQHRAHVRILFEKFVKYDVDSPMPSQQVMFPEILTLSASESVMLESIQDRMAALGFQLSFLGDNSWAINGVPSNEALTDYVQLVKDIIADVADGSDMAVNQINELVALRMAKAAAIPDGRQLTSTEMEHLMSDLFSISTPNFTPDGLRVVAQIDASQIASLF